MVLKPPTRWYPGAVAAGLAAVLIVLPPADAGQAAPVGSIRGQLDIRRLAAAPSTRPGVTDLSGSQLRGLPDMRRGLVYFDVAPGSAFDDREPERAVMDQRHETFMPRLLAIQTGSTVAFPNSDSTYHNVFSLSRARRFNLGRYAAGRTKSVRFNRPGVVRVFCDIHSHMSAFVVVFNHPYFTVTDAEGRFRIDNVPQGTYTVVGWYEGEARVRRSVTVTGGSAADVELVVP